MIIGFCALQAFSPDGTRVITGDVEITAVKIWDVSLSDGAEVQSFPTDRLAPVDVAFLPNGRVVASIGRGLVAVWEVGSKRRVLTIGPGSGPPEPVVRIAVNRDGTRIATMRNFSPEATVWDVSTGERWRHGLSRQLCGHTRSGRFAPALDWPGTPHSATR
jgi:WD40 repeat protein